MAHHLFCPPLKATTDIDFSSKLAVTATDAAGKDLLRSLNEARRELIKALSNWDLKADAFAAVSSKYISLLRGFTDPTDAPTGAQADEEKTAAPIADASAEEKSAAPADKEGKDAKESKDGKGKGDKAKDGKGKGEKAKDGKPEAPKAVPAAPFADNAMRHLVQFTWTNTLGTIPQTTQCDAQFELVSMLEDMAIWHAKRAIKILADTEADEDVTKEAFSLLKVGAGILFHIEQSELARLREPGKSTDTSPIVVRAYAHQQIAEAQEIVLFRAVAKKNAPKLIAQLALDTGAKYTRALTDVRGIEAKGKTDKWRGYLEYKQLAMEAFGRAHAAAELLVEDKCGAAIAVARTADATWKKALAACDVHFAAEPKTQGSAQAAPPIARTERIIREISAKATRENDFVYFQKVPEDVPALPEAKGLTDPTPYELPARSELWARGPYGGLHPGKAIPPKEIRGESAEAIVPMGDAKSTSDGTFDLCTLL